MTLIRNAESRRTETPNGVMTTAATPTQGGTEGIAVWRVKGTPGRTGPLHAFDTEQVWTFLDGDAIRTRSWDVSRPKRTGAVSASGPFEGGESRGARAAHSCSRHDA